MSSNLTTVSFVCSWILDKDARRNVPKYSLAARLAQLVERKALNLVVVGSSPTVGILIPFIFIYLVSQCFDIAAQIEINFRRVVGLVVRISAFQADGPGSIPGQRNFIFQR